MVDISELHSGDRVKIVDAWCEGCYENNNGLMDKYLSTVMTVRSVHSNRVNMEEDNGRWYWFPESIERFENDLCLVGNLDDYIKEITPIIH